MILLSMLVLLVTLVIGVPVPMAFFATAMLLFFSGDYMLSFLLSSGVNKASSTLLFAIPLFIMAGGIMQRGNIGAQLISLVEMAVGKVKGGLGVVGIVSSALFGSVTGSACATISCIGSIMFPKLQANGYPRGHSAAIMANASVLGMLIPPSGIMILYAWLSGQSVLACFLSTVIPGILLTILLSLINVFLLRDVSSVQVAEPSSGNQIGETFRRFKVAAPALFMPVLVLGGIYSGMMTPTEAAVVSVIYAIPVGMFIYRGLDFKGLIESLIESATTTGVIMFMLICVMILSRIYIMEDLPSQILSVFQAVSSNRYVIMLMINIFMVVIGMLMDDTSAVLLCTPILVPVVMQIGISPIHFAAILGVNLGLGNITPPCAPLLYLGGRLGDAPINEMMNTTLSMIFLGWIPTLLLTTYIPGLATFLPNLLLGIK